MPSWTVIAALGVFVLLLVLPWLLGLRYIPHNNVGVVEKLWSPLGSLGKGRIIACAAEAGFQSEILRGGMHTFYFPWQYRIHKQPLVIVPESRIGYVYARDGRPLPTTQTLGRTVECNYFQDAHAFLQAGGQRGRQRAVLREGVYAINLALFVVITEERVYAGPLRDTSATLYADWQAQLRRLHGFSPVIVGHGQRQTQDGAEPALGELSAADTIGVVTVTDGAPIEPGEIIAPQVEARGGNDHNYFQDPEAFLALGGRRGKQLQVLTDGTFFINRWFATIETLPKTLIPIGYVGVVVSYYGTHGDDLTGAGFRYGEQVEPGQRGVWKRALAPGKYPLNPFALRVELVPTVNFVLRWITGLVEAHQYDKDLKSIDLITADGYEPVLPLSLVLHIDYEKAPSVIQRFGDVHRLISQTLDPILSAYFRDVAQSSHMLDLLTQREDIQRRATAELGRRFADYDINCIAVMIGRPESKVMVGGVDPIERLFDQLRERRLAEEQKQTYGKQEEAAVRLKSLNDAQAAAAKQAELTQTKIEIEVSGNRGEAQLAESRRLAERDVVRATGEGRSRELLAAADGRVKELLGEGEGRSREAIGRGESSRIAQTGLAEAAVFLQKVRAWGDPRLFALNLVAEQFSKSAQPIVPERLFMLGGADQADAVGTTNVFSQLAALLVAEKSGFKPNEGTESVAELEKLTAELAARFKAETRAPEPKK
jgi:uncharacterized membrane protein YqiK